MQVTVPAGVSPGEMVQIQTPSGQMVQAQVPAGLQPGQAFQIELAPQPQAAPMSGLAYGSSAYGPPEFIPSQPQVVSDYNEPRVPTTVTIPGGVVPGGQFQATMPSGAQVLVNCPEGSKSGDQIQFMAPASAEAAAAGIDVGG